MTEQNAIWLLAATTLIIQMSVKYEFQKLKNGMGW